MPPIYQPEVAAEAIVWAARHPRREIFVGMPTVGVIVGDRIAPGALDRYLARFGYDLQQTEEPADPDRKDNLWHALPGDYGPHGRFDASARDSSVEFWLATHKRALAAGAGILGAAAFFSARR